MISPQPSRLRMKRRKTVSVTPAMGASTVAGEIRTSPIKRLAGTGFGGAGWRTGVSAPHEPELSQNFFTLLFYFPRQAARPHGAADALVRRAALIRTAVEELPPRTRRPGLHEVHKTKPSPQRGLETFTESGLVLRRCSGWSRRNLGVLAAEALHAAGGVHQLLLAGEEGVAVRANFNADVALVRRTGHKCVAARAMHAYFVISGMNGCFHGI